MSKKPTKPCDKAGRMIQLDPGGKQAELQSQLKELAREIGSGLSELEPSQSKDLLGAFVSELFLTVAEQTQHRDRQQRQAEKIAAAKLRGIRFGPAAKALPDNFYECRDAWRNGQMTLRQAAEACGMPHSSFHDAVVRTERAG